MERNCRSTSRSTANFRVTRPTADCRLAWVLDVPFCKRGRERPRAETGVYAGITAWIVCAFTFIAGASRAGEPTWSPPWTKDLVIYVVATKAFTSPNGPESGTFDSLKAKFPYLQELGITGIWLTGHSLSDPHHFFNVWTQYACIEPDKIDPSLGTPEQFKSMIDNAHRHGIKIFLDVITHGVMAYSPVVKQHPEWFRGGSWGMIDYDWDGGHTDLDDWWVKTWTDAVKEYGVDGFRLDLGIEGGNQGRVDLWARIRKNAEAAGHTIVIFEEGDSVVPGVTDFSQGGNRISNPVAPNQLNPLLVNDIPGWYARRYGKAGTYTVEIDYQDGTSAKGTTATSDELRVRLDGRTVDRASARGGDKVAGIDPITRSDPTGQKQADGVRRADGVPDVQLSVSNVATKSIKNITVTLDDGGIFPPGGSRWEMSPPVNGDAHVLAWEGNAPDLTLYVPTAGYDSTIELSAHDNGWWEGDENPYAAQGSRALFGYSMLFAPRIPLFMAGEEFDATFHPLPGLTVDTTAHKNKGNGKIVLGSMLNWNELEEPRHRTMLEDVKRMSALRKREPSLLMPVIYGDQAPPLVPVPYKASIDVPVPYMRWSGTAAVVVLANRNTTADARITLDIPLEKLGLLQQDTRYTVTDLWNGGRPKIYTAGQLASFVQVVNRDKTPRGGIGLLKVERLR
jgi:hypothetical protein